MTTPGVVLVAPGVAVPVLGDSPPPSEPSGPEPSPACCTTGTVLPTFQWWLSATFLLTPIPLDRSSKEPWTTASLRTAYSPSGSTP